METPNHPHTTQAPNHLPGFGGRDEYHALFFDSVSAPAPIGELALRMNAELGLSVLRADCGETELPDDERFAVRLRFPHDVALDEIRALFAVLRERLTDELAASMLDQWRTERGGA